MERQKTANYEMLNDFIEKHMQVNQRYNVRDIYKTYKEAHPEDAIGQKDFAMFLRYNVEKENGLLKRTAHGIYEKRINPQEYSVKFPRKKPDNNINQILDDPYMEGIVINPQDTGLDKLYDDAMTLMARMRYAVKNIYEYAKPCPEYQPELESLLVGTMKNMDRVATDISAVMAWCDDHMDEIDLARDMEDSPSEDETMTLQM